MNGNRLLPGQKITVLIVDDSITMCAAMKSGLEATGKFTVVGMAQDPYIARDMLVSANPDVMTLDLEMPRMNGVEFIKKLFLQFKLPTVVVSSMGRKSPGVITETLRVGAFEFLDKPSAMLGNTFSLFIGKLSDTLEQAFYAVPKDNQVKTVSSTQLKNVEYHVSKSAFDMIVIGASTGGTDAIRVILNNLPPNLPPIVIVQHMPEGFTNLFAQSLQKTSKLSVKEGVDSERLRYGTAYVAPGNFHTEVKRQGDDYTLTCYSGAKVNGHCPSVEPLFLSAAKHVKNKTLGIILTGMGADGAKAMVELRQSGAITVAQDEKSSVVFGMPKEAIEHGAVMHILSLDCIAAFIVKTINGDLK